MYKATRPNAAPIAAWPYPLALEHHTFLKQELKNLPDAGIIKKTMSTWASPIVVVKKHTTEGAPQKFHLCISYRKVNSLLPAVTPAGGTKKGALTLMTLPKIDELCPIKRSKVLYHTGPPKWLLPHKTG